MAPINGTLKILSITITVVILGAGLVASYTLLGAKADANSEDVKKLEDEHSEDVEEIKAEQFLQWIDIDANNDRGIRIEVQMTNIEEKVDDILDTVKELHQ